jgi:hypothetical protein
MINYTTLNFSSNKDINYNKIFLIKYNREFNKSTSKSKFAMMKSPKNKTKLKLKELLKTFNISSRRILILKLK